MSVNDLVLVQGMADTRRALARWNRHPGHVLGPCVALSVAIAVALLAATFVTVAIAVPVLLASAAVELWVSPRLLTALT